MRNIMVINPKGGSGKSTIATNLASYYASRGAQVALMDFDPQGSSCEWLEARPVGRAPVKLLRAWQGETRSPRNAELVVMDVPAALDAKSLTAYLRRAESVIVPVLPSPIDIRAARHFLADLKDSARVQHKQTKFAVVGNRVKENTIIYHELEDFLKSQRVTVLGHLRDSMNYLRAAERGIGIFELPPYASQTDRAQWQPIIRWLQSKRSRSNA